MNERLKTHSKTQKKSADLVSNKLRIGVFQQYQMKCKSVSKKSPRYITQLKLQHIQFNVVNADTLREAQQRPQDYAGLVVRVAGYSAFFVELSKEIQDDIIRRTAHQL
nr:hypothetical protein [Escherichia coli]